ncbi:unnamed protein product, partial [marine sediment metagenome]
PFSYELSTKHRSNLKACGVIERVYKIFRVHTLTPKAQNALSELE